MILLAWLTVGLSGSTIPSGMKKSFFASLWSLFARS